ncbi:MAG: DsbA family oxidoreductase [Rhodospirillaceae bacterium]|nr:DsbA family oxidoreductase [Rhodospirillaceae bacterium]
MSARSVSSYTIADAIRAFDRPHMLVEIIADITCPWCFIGLKRLQRALALRPTYNPTFQWRPFLLNPDLHDGSVNRHHYLTRVFGSESRIQQFQNAVDTAGIAVGIAFNFQSADFTPSSINAHRLISYASGQISPLIVAEMLFEAYFVDGKNIGTPEVLISLASALGLAPDDTRVFLESDEGKQAVFDENTKIHRLGVNGVPAFVFGKRNIISGAQEPQALVNVLDFLSTAEQLEQNDEENSHEAGP